MIPTFISFLFYFSRLYFNILFHFSKTGIDSQPPLFRNNHGPRVSKRRKSEWRLCAALRPDALLAILFTSFLCIVQCDYFLCICLVFFRRCDRLCMRDCLVWWGGCLINNFLRRAIIRLMFGVVEPFIWTCMYIWLS